MRKLDVKDNFLKDAASSSFLITEICLPWELSAFMTLFNLDSWICQQDIYYYGHFKKGHIIHIFLYSKNIFLQKKKHLNFSKKKNFPTHVFYKIIIKVNNPFFNIFSGYISSPNWI